MPLDYQPLKDALRQSGLDLDKITDRLGCPLEDKIKPLVAVLNICGYKTTGSCEGHGLEEFKRRANRHKREGDRIIEINKYKFFVDRNFFSLEHDQSPWVDLRIDDLQKTNLDLILVRFNFSHAIPWTTETWANNCRISAEYKHSLEELQATIPKLAEFLYNAHFKA